MICVDSSVAAKWLLREQYSTKSRALLRTQLEEQQLIIAPPLLPIEIANILRQRIRAGALTPGHAQRRLSRFLALPLTVLAPPDLYSRALAIAVERNLPAVYDPLYVALAESMACPLWTADQKLIRAVGTHFPFIRWIGDYQGGETA
ncbi:MAG: type II toxin-antitoxin system VapC family toxin [Chloroflexi bacterium]|nr:type II toxin-antitoxin system VapC family toxin [Chloroflexota bacterium]